MLAPLYRAAGGPATAAELRAQGLATSLRALGHRVTVVCAMPKGAEPDRRADVEVVPAAWLDLEALARSAGLKSGSLVQPRLSGGPPRHTLLRSIVSKLVIDRHMTWIPAAILAARRVGGKGAIFVSTGARSSHIAARFARGRQPWIADLNDLWAMNPHYPRRMVQDTVDRLLERLTIANATRLTTVNDLMARELERRFPIRVTTIMSAFEPGDFDRRTRAGGSGGPIRILFAGTVYRSLDMRPFLKALRQGRQEGWLRKESLEVAFVGRLSERIALEAGELGVADLVTTSGLIPREELLDRLVDADALLLPLYENDPYALPMRFFEYVGAGRPIIGYGPPDRIAGRLIAEQRLGVVVSDQSETEQLLRLLVVEGATLPRPAPAVRREFTWERRIETLRELIADVGANP